MGKAERIFLSPPWMGGSERALVDEAFASKYIAPCGPMVDRFERDFASAVGLPHACAVSSCTAALDLLFHELGVGPGDSVVCSDLTFVASIAPAVRWTMVANAPASRSAGSAQTSGNSATGSQMSPAASSFARQ